MNAYPNSAAINKALVMTGLSSELATLTDHSPISDLWNLSRAADSTPAKITELAASL